MSATNDEDMLTYTYDTGQITRDFHLKRLEGDCKRDPEMTVNIGVMCRTCPFYGGEFRWHGREYLIRCKYHKEDDPGLQDVVSDIYDKFEREAMTHYYD